MAAHVPRRVFAPSLVIIAALPACNSPEDKPVQGPTTTPTTSVTIASPTSTPTPSASTTAAAPTATASAKTAPGEDWQIVRQSPAGTCTAYVNMECPRGEMCNPPPPSDYPCPKDARALNSLPNTLTRAAGSQQCVMDVVEVIGGGSCPPGMHCNPPPPHHISVTLPCPK